MELLVAVEQQLPFQRQPTASRAGRGGITGGVSPLSHWISQESKTVSNSKLAHIYAFKYIYIFKKDDFSTAKLVLAGTRGSTTEFS